MVPLGLYARQLSELAWPPLRRFHKWAGCVGALVCLLVPGDGPSLGGHGVPYPSPQTQDLKQWGAGRHMAPGPEALAETHASNAGGPGFDPWSGN